MTPIKSPGTVTPSWAEEGFQKRKLRDMAYDYGTAVVSGRRVLWFQLAPPVSFSLPEDGRTTTQLLRDSIAQAEGRYEDRGLATRINGIVGGLISKEERVQSADSALSVLEYRFPASHPDLRHFMEIEDFRTYLRRKAMERVARSAST